MDGHDAGYRILPHTADLLLEAWGPSRTRCFEQAVRALVGSFVASTDVPATEPVGITIDAGPDNEMLAAVLDEVLFLADVAGKVPVHVTLEQVDGGGIAGVMDVAPVDETNTIGPLPKGASYGGEVTVDGGVWRCRVVIDV